MAKTAVVKARIEPDLKADAEYILRELGLSPTVAVALFYKQITLARGLPFEVKIPNEVTLKTFKETDAGENWNRTENKEELFEQLGIKCANLLIQTSSRKTLKVSKSAGKILAI